MSGKKVEHRFIGPQSLLEGSLSDRMREFLGALVGQPDADQNRDSRLSGYGFRFRVEMGVHMEFGMKARLTFPYAHSVRLQCGHTDMLLTP